MPNESRLNELENELARLRLECEQLKFAIENLQADRDSHVRAYRVLYEARMHGGNEGQ